ncbi:hypothetical protein Ddye_010461 [Dipteronia dyeriana]|uniref:Uncharacterized protein n=1 Tax=Dipteronia dyeriana TaxID=168575 RepID=A0AAD9XDC7_9ROSI|nr:hypothetical protein Ddye_010461 [Dipteronia dyeriana]
MTFVSKSHHVMPQQHMATLPSVVYVNPQRCGGECLRMDVHFRVIHEQPPEHQHQQQHSFERRNADV